MKKIEESMNNIIEKQKGLVTKIDESVEAIKNNNMTKYMQIEKIIMLNVNDMKDFEKQMIEELKGKKISEIIKESEISNSEKELIFEKVKEMVMNYRYIDQRLHQIRIMLEPKVEIGEIILQTINEEVEKIKNDGGNIYNEKI